MSQIEVILRIFVIACFVLLLGVGCASAATLVVNQTSPACTTGDFYCDTIQEAVDMAKWGDTIVVCPGTYVENINITKFISIKSHFGSSDTIIEAKNIKDNVITITANKVNISGFTIRNSKAEGIYLKFADNCNISENNIYSTRNGIYLTLSNNNKISYNTVNLNDNCGIFLFSSNDNLILNNTVNSNKQYHGIQLSSSNNNIIMENNASNNFQCGIALFDSSNYNTISGNIANSNEQFHGVSLKSSNNNIIIENNASNNFLDGIKLSESSNNTIKGNYASYNFKGGIRLSDSNNNTVRGNTANSNKQYHGIQLSSSNNNIIMENNASNNERAGIGLSESDNNTIRGNEITNNHEGIGIRTFAGHRKIHYIYDDYGRFLYKIMYIGSIAGNNTLLNNTICKNKEDGIYLEYATNNKIIGNNIYENGGKDVKLAYSQKNTIINNRIGRCWLGWSSNFNNISNNEIYDTLYLQPSTYPVPDFRITGNIISKNNVKSNLSLRYSLKNEIYLNSMDNVSTSLSYSSDIWNSTSKITYTYKGKRYTKYMGNYWSDYKETDADEDGIGNTPYSIDSDKDRYPLMEPWENYFIIKIEDNPILKREGGVSHEPN